MAAVCGGVTVRGGLHLHAGGLFLIHIEKQIEMAATENSKSSMSRQNNYEESNGMVIIRRSGCDQGSPLPQVRNSHPNCSPANFGSPARAAVREQDCHEAAYGRCRYHDFSRSALGRVFPVMYIVQINEIKRKIIKMNDDVKLKSCLP